MVDKKPIGFALFSRVLIFLIGFISSTVIPLWRKDLATIELPLFGLFARWDSFYYLDIACVGYSGRIEFWAFRPLYPLLLRLYGIPFEGYLGKVESYLAVGVFWNLLAFIVATVYLYKLTEILLDEESAYYTILLISIYPGTVFFTALYPESTYLLLVVSSLFYLEKGRMAISIPLAVLAGLTRPEGFLLSVFFVFKALNSGGYEKLRSLLGSVAIASTLPAFIFYSYILTGNLFTVFEVEENWPKVTLWKIFHMDLNEMINRLTGIYTISTLVIIISLLSIAISLFNFQLSRSSLKVTLKLNFSDRKTPYYLWTVTLLVLFIFTGEHASLPRYTSLLFPILWSNTLWMRGSKTKLYTLISIYITLMTLGTLFFVNWYPYI